MADRQPFSSVSPRQKRKGLFFSFEGPEGAGKSTQMEMLAQVLVKRGCDVVRTREPGGTGLGEALRRLLKHADKTEIPGPQAELLLMAASRAQLVNELIRPALAAGRVVLCDRFIDSTTAYQGYGRGLELDFINQLNHFTVGDCLPNLTFLLDLPVAMSEERSRRRALAEVGPDRFEQEHRPFHQRVRDGYLTLAGQASERIRMIDAARSPAAVHTEIMSLAAAFSPLREGSAEGD